MFAKFWKIENANLPMLWTHSCAFEDFVHNAESIPLIFHAGRITPHKQIVPN